MTSIAYLTTLFIFSMIVTNSLGVFAISVFHDPETCNISMNDYKSSAMYDPKVSLEDDKKRCSSFAKQAVALVFTFLVILDGIACILFGRVLYDSRKKDKMSLVFDDVSYSFPIGVAKPDKPWKTLPKGFGKDG